MLDLCFQTVFCLLVWFLLLFEAGHDVLGKRNSYKQASNGVLVRCGGGEAFFSPKIEYQSSSELVLVGCEFQKCFLVLPTLKVGQKGQNGLELDMSFTPVWLDSDKIAIG